DESGRVDPATRIVAISRADEGRGEFAHLKMQVRPISSICCPHRRDLLTAPHFLSRFHEDLVDVRVVRLHVFSYPVFFIGMEYDYDVAPAWSGLIREQHAAIGHRVDRIPQVAVLTADAVQIVA